MAWRGRRAMARRAHAGLNHSSALADASDANGPSAQVELNRDLLAPRVTGHDGLSGVGGVARSGTQRRRCFQNTRADIVHRQRDPDSASGASEHRAAWEATRLFGETNHLQGISHAWFAGAGVGVARVDDDGLGAAFSYARRTQLHWRRANLVGGEGACDRGRHLRHDKRQVALPAFVRAFAGADALDVAKHPAGPEPLRSDD